MLNELEQKQLLKLLGYAIDREEVLNLEQLEGFLFGIAMTPDTFVPSEWFNAIFGESGAEFPDQQTADELLIEMAQVLERFHQQFKSGKLSLPVLLTEPNKETLLKLSDWAQGFDRALATRPELWMPDHVLEKDDFTAEEDALMSSLMIVLGVAYPERISEVFEIDDDEDAQEAWCVLVGQLPLAVQSLQNYARELTIESSSN